MRGGTGHLPERNDLSCRVYENVSARHFLKTAPGRDAVRRGRRKEKKYGVKVLKQKTNAVRSLLSQACSWRDEVFI